jgi:hypothetical protein
MGPNRGGRQNAKAGHEVYSVLLYFLDMVKPSQIFVSTLSGKKHTNKHSNKQAKKLNTVA